MDQIQSVVQYLVRTRVGASIQVGVRHRDDLHAGSQRGLNAGRGVFEDQTLLGRCVQPACRNQEDIGRRFPVDDGGVVSEHDAVEKTEPISMTRGLNLKGALVRTTGYGLGNPVAVQVFGQLDGAGLRFGLQQQAVEHFVPFASGTRAGLMGKSSDLVRMVAESKARFPITRDLIGPIEGLAVAPRDVPSGFGVEALGVEEQAVQIIDYMGDAFIDDLRLTIDD